VNIIQCGLVEKFKKASKNSAEYAQLLDEICRLERFEVKKDLLTEFLKTMPLSDPKYKDLKDALDGNFISTKNFCTNPVTRNVKFQNTTHPNYTAFEQEYIEDLKDCLSDNIITDDERRILERRRAKLNISKERADKLEKEVIASLSVPKLTEEEQDYIEDLKDCLSDNVITDDERRILERRRNKLGISEERVDELEKEVVFSLSATKLAEEELEERIIEAEVVSEEAETEQVESSSNSDEVAKKEVDVLAKYSELSSKARKSSDPTYDIEAAVAAPSLFLKNPDNFEATFDIIINHLTSALEKSRDDDSIAIVRHTASDLIYAHVYILEDLINRAERESKKSWLQKVGDVLSGLVKDIFSYGILGGLAASSPEIAATVKLYFDNLYKNWLIITQKEELYIQMGNMFMKVFKTDLIVDKSNLSIATFKRTKERIFTHQIAKGQLDNALRLATTVEKDEESLAINYGYITTQLASSGQWDININVMKEAKAKISNESYSKLKNNVLLNLKRVLDNPDKKTKGKREGNLGCLATVISILILVALHYTNVVVGGFWWHAMWYCIIFGVLGLFSYEILPKIMTSFKLSSYSRKI
ncbi:MAG: hypothetical protein WCR55_09860, partial [Lentisphaerota bacterium]